MLNLNHKAKDMSEKSKLLSYRDLSERIGFPEGTLRLWVMQGRLKPVRFGNRVRFTEDYVRQIEQSGIPVKYGHL